MAQTLRLGKNGGRVTVVGVTGPTRTRALSREQPELFVRLDGGHYEREVTLVAHTDGPAAPQVRAIAGAAAAVDANVALAAVKTMARRMDVQLWPFRTMTWLFSICGGLAVILATAGLTAVVIHAVNRRVREFGVRLSLGATPRNLMREVLTGSARMLVPGLTVGLLLAAGAAQLARFLFIGVNGLNPFIYLVVAMLQVLIVVMACLAPALRASRVDPLVALRAE